MAGAAQCTLDREILKLFKNTWNLKKNQILVIWISMMKRANCSKKKNLYLPAFLQFSTDFSETLSKCFSFPGRLNCAIRSDLTLLHSAHFALRNAHFAHKKSALYLKKQKSWKTGAKCALCSAKCALCSSVWSDLSARFKLPWKKKLMLWISIYLVKNWRNAGK